MGVKLLSKFLKQECRDIVKHIHLSELYGKKVSNTTELNITTNKWLYNYQYVGIIAQHMPNANIIHCYRNPLDNILSIYRAHFAKGNEYSSSLIDSANVYLDQDEIMTEYKNRYRSKIYDLNYDSLVINPNGKKLCDLGTNTGYSVLKIKVD